MATRRKTAKKKVAKRKSIKAKKTKARRRKAAAFSPGVERVLGRRLRVTCGYLTAGEWGQPASFGLFGCQFGLYQSSPGSRSRWFLGGPAYCGRHAYVQRNSGWQQLGPRSSLHWHRRVRSQLVCRYARFHRLRDASVRRQAWRVVLRGGAVPDERGAHRVQRQPHHRRRFCH